MDDVAAQGPDWRLTAAGWFTTSQTIPAHNTALKTSQRRDERSRLLEIAEAAAII